LSICNNCISTVVKPSKKEAVGARSRAAKKAETLFMNLEGMLKRRGIDGIAFITLTFAENMTCRKEAQKCFHSFATNFLYHEIPEFVAVVERQNRGAIHYHIVAFLGFDIRTGFDFASCAAANLARRAGDVVSERQFKKRYSDSANPNLRNWWAKLGNSKYPGAAQNHGFGRCETLPILSTAEGLARYVGSYVGSELLAREQRDKGLRTIRYSLIPGGRAASIYWSWASGQGRVWRLGCAVLACIVGADDLRSTLGKGWAWNWKQAITAFGRNYSECVAAVHDAEFSSLQRVERLALASRLAGAVLAFENSGKDFGLTLALKDSLRMV
jgi:hypothetical protein